ncbi:MAG: Rne/Rng family ribonuclease [Scytolyngbya sp. HA4215-MV1]|jgi:ribonuclease E|nr:Rne/Rng family ribonuclease [Scytolyngbya sp. HA4215-MV1]
MPKQIVIAEQHRIAAVFSEDQIQELIVATGSHQVSDVYLGIVENVLPGIDAAFVNIGDSERNGFIHVSDLGPLRLKRSAGSITELLVPQQKVLVQVMKEPTGNKGPRLTGNISLPGRYLVMMPYGRGVNLSRRIRNENERHRLRALAILIKPAGMGLVIRTEAENMPEEAIIEDMESLQKQWEAVLQEASTTRAPALLNRDDDFIQRVLRDVYSADVNRIVVDSHTGLKRVKQHLLNWSGGKPTQGVLIDHHRESIPLLEYFRVNAAIREALKPRVDLPSGGYIIIEPTEALTVIDVNSGSFTRSATARETVLWTNCEAATEIARQLRLRNIAGVIVVDFIDMDSRRDQLQVLEHFEKALRADKARPQIAQLSELGLVELTRKRQGKNIYELFGRPCQTCGGLGHLVHLPGEPEASDGEIVERPAAREYRSIESRNSEHRGRGRSREPLPDVGGLSADLVVQKELLWEGRNEDSDLEPSEELDLLQHPNYQERGGGLAGNRRRRRRRVGEGPTPKEAGNSRGMLWEEGSKGESVESLPNLRSSLSPPAEAMPTTGRGRGRGSAHREILDNAPEATEGEERRGRSRRDSSKPTSEPPEIVSIEMTPEEQDVYAWMGISPLVLTNQEVKNPKSAIVSVILPGQTPTVVQEIESRAARVEQVSSFDLEPTAFSNGSEEDADSDASPESEEPSFSTRESEGDADATSRRRRRRNPSESKPISLVAPIVVPESSVESTAALDDNPEVEEESTAATRRRRRRSSASASE